MKINTIHIIPLLLLALIHTKTNAQLIFEAGINVSTALNFGTQNNHISFNINANTVTQNTKAALEICGGLGVDFFLSKYGAQTKGIAFNLEGYFIAGPSKDKTNLPFYSGELGRLATTNYNNNFNTFSGGGFGVYKTIIKGELAHIANQQGMLLMRLRNSNGVFLMRIRNDFRSFFMQGSGTDQGETGNFYFGYTLADNRNYLHTLGLNLALITPKPDYSRNPTNPLNSKNNSRPVLFGVKPFDDLFHGNLFVNYQFSTPYFDQYVGLGIDSRKIGAKLQNALHDSFGIYPRFGWNTEAKNSIYFQSKTSLTYGF